MPKIVKLADGSTVELSPAITALQASDTRITDGDAVFMQRQLEAIESQTYDVLYPDLEARDVFTTNSFGGAGAQTLTYRSYGRVGSAAVINARAIDLPKSDIHGKEYSIGVKSMGVAYDFDIDEIAAAQMAGMPLEARKAMAARRGYEELVNKIVWDGHKETGLKGLFDNQDITRSNVAAGVAGGTEWEKKTPDEILADMNAAAAAMYTSTKKIHKPDTLLLPVAKWAYIAQTPRSPMSDTTILQYFLANNQFIKSVKPLNILEGRGAVGAECMIVMTATTNEGTQTVRIREPLPLQFLPVQLHGLVYEVPGRGRFAGLEVTYPAAIAIWSGI